MILGQILHFKLRNVGTLNLYQFATKNWYWTKFHSTSQGMQDNRTFISSVVKMDLGPNSTFQAKECRNISRYFRMVLLHLEWCSWVSHCYCLKTIQTCANWILVYLYTYAWQIILNSYFLMIQLTLSTAWTAKLVCWFAVLIV